MHAALYRLGQSGGYQRASDCEATRWLPLDLGRACADTLDQHPHVSFRMRTHLSANCLLPTACMCVCVSNNTDPTCIHALVHPCTGSVKRDVVHGKRDLRRIACHSAKETKGFTKWNQNGWRKGVKRRFAEPHSPQYTVTTQLCQWMRSPDASASDICACVCMEHKCGCL